MQLVRVRECGALVNYDRPEGTRRARPDRSYWCRFHEEFREALRQVHPYHRRAANVKNKPINLSYSVKLPAGSLAAPAGRCS